MLSRFAEPLVNIDQFLKKNGTRPAAFQIDGTTLAGDRKSPYKIQLRMVKIGQTFATWQSKMGLAVGRPNEEGTDLRLRHQR